jgi:hypothetical protein
MGPLAYGLAGRTKWNVIVPEMEGSAEKNRISGALPLNVTTALLADLNGLREPSSFPSSSVRFSPLMVLFHFRTHTLPPLSATRWTPFWTVRPPKLTLPPFFATTVQSAEKVTVFSLSPQTWLLSAA